MTSDRETEATISYRKSTTNLMGNLHQADGTTLVLESFSCPSGICYLVGEQPKIMSEIHEPSTLITEEETKQMIRDGLLPEKGQDYSEEQPDGEDDGVDALVSVTFHFTPEYKKKYPDLFMAANNFVAQGNRNYRKNNMPIRLIYHCHMLTTFAESTSNFQPGERIFGQGVSKNPIGFILKEFGNPRNGDPVRNSADIAVVLAAGLAPEERMRYPSGGALDLTWATRGLSIAYIYDYAASSIYTFDHEVAHLFGARHDRLGEAGKLNI